VGVGTMLPGDTSTLLTLNVLGSGAKVVVSSGTTLTTANIENGGSAVIRCAATTITLRDGNTKLTREGSGAVTTLNANGAATDKGTGTITTVNIEDSGSVNTRETNVARTYTSTNVYGNGTLKTDLNTTFTNGVDFIRGAVSTQGDFGDNVTLTPSAT
jgi:hypothetical protein